MDAHKDAAAPAVPGLAVPDDRPAAPGVGGLDLDTAPEVTVSFAGQIATLTSNNDLKQIAVDLTRYFAHNLAKFADQRGADMFLQVAVKRDGETAGHEYRNGRFVKEEATDA